MTLTGTDSMRTSGPRLLAMSPPFAVSSTSMLDANFAPDWPEPAAVRLNRRLPDPPTADAVVTKSPPGAIEAMNNRYVPAVASGTSTSCGSVPGSVTRQPGICRTTFGPGITIPHARPNESITTRYAGECMPNRSRFGGVVTGAGAVGGAFGAAVVVCPDRRTTL